MSKELGRGVWGIVFSAVDAKGNTCAIKVHKNEPGSLPWEFLLSRRMTQRGLRGLYMEANELGVYSNGAVMTMER